MLAGKKGIGPALRERVNEPGGSLARLATPRFVVSQATSQQFHSSVPYSLRPAVTYALVRCGASCGWLSSFVGRTRSNCLGQVDHVRG